jgi:hypothetical protein
VDHPVVKFLDLCSRISCRIEACRRNQTLFSHQACVNTTTLRLFSLCYKADQVNNTMDRSTSSNSLANDIVPDTALPTTMQPAISSGVNNIETLPNEVLHILLGKLPLSDLKAIRLTSKTFSKMSVEHLFKHIRVIIHLESKHRFANIANKPEFRERVRTLSLDLRTTLSEPLSHEEWLLRCQQLANSSNPSSNSDLQGHYDSYLKFAEEEQEASMLGFQGVCSLLKDFPMVQHLELNGGIDHGAEEPTPQDFIDFKTNLPQIGLVPHRKGNPYSIFHAAQILTTAWTGKKSLTSLSLIGLDWNFIRPSMFAGRTQWWGPMSNIRHLKLRLCVASYKPPLFGIRPHLALKHLATAYAQLINNPTRLDSLDFGLLVEPNRDRRAMPLAGHGEEKLLFGALIFQPAFIRQIKKLSFSEFVFSPNDFIRLLSCNEEQSLKSLAFHKIHLCEGSWLVFLRQLAVAVDLNHFSLSGWISSVHEGWNALTQEEAAAYYGSKEERLYPYERDSFDTNPDCLVDCDGFSDWNDKIPVLEEMWCVRARIEDWVTSGGGTRRDLKTNQANNPTKWAGWPAEHHDGFPLMRGYFPPCAVHHAPSTERQLQYRYESRWRSRHNRDFSFVWAEDLLQCVEVVEGGTGNHVRRWERRRRRGRGRSSARLCCWRTSLLWVRGWFVRIRRTSLRSIMTMSLLSGR